jgi:hypothetical protein
VETPNYASRSFVRELGDDLYTRIEALEKQVVKLQDQMQLIIDWMTLKDEHLGQ